MMGSNTHGRCIVSKLVHVFDEYTRQYVLAWMRTDQSVRLERAPFFPAKTLRCTMIAEEVASVEES